MSSKSKILENPYFQGPDQTSTSLVELKSYREHSGTSRAGLVAADLLIPFRDGTLMAEADAGGLVEALIWKSLQQ